MVIPMIVMTWDDHSTDRVDGTRVVTQHVIPDGSVPPWESQECVLLGGFEHEWIIFHFIYGMSSETHWRSPSFFKMGTLHHQAVSIQQTPGSGSKHDHRYCLLIFPGWELSIDSCWEGPSWDWYSKMGQREHGIAETPKTWWLYTLYRLYLMVDHLLTISLALP